MLIISGRACHSSKIGAILPRAIVDAVVILCFETNASIMFDVVDKAEEAVR